MPQGVLYAAKSGQKLYMSCSSGLDSPAIPSLAVQLFNHAGPAFTFARAGGREERGQEGCVCGGGAGERKGGRSEKQGRRGAGVDGRGIPNACTHTVH